MGERLRLLELAARAEVGSCRVAEGLGSAGQQVNAFLLLLCVSAPVVGAVLQLATEHEDDPAFVGGPLLPLSLLFYLLSNHLLANAVFLYARSVPTPLRALLWLAIVGSGFDHVVETAQWVGGVVEKHVGPRQASESGESGKGAEPVGDRLRVKQKRKTERKKDARK